MDKGVSGFRVDAVNMMYEVDPKDFGGKFPDEPLSGKHFFQTLQGERSCTFLSKKVT